MRPWVLELPVDRELYRIDLRTRMYEYAGRNPAWEQLPAAQNARNKRQLHGLRRVFRDGTTKVFTDPAWPYTQDHPCRVCYSWIPRDSPCDHPMYQCPACGRRQCLLQ